MATEKQIAANRANAKKSTGPRSRAGKEKSSRNAIRHGLTSRSFLFEQESGDRFLEHLNNFQVVWQPASFQEERLVRQMAVAKWRQQHVWAVETTKLNAEIPRQRSLNPDYEAGTATSAAFSTLSETPVLELLSRYDERFCRQYDHAVSRLMRLRNQKIEF